MREIIFRGKRLDNGEWVKGNLISPATETGSTLICTGNDFMRAFYEVDPKTVGQYTGLVDRNEKMIFDGDLIKTRYGRICKIEWFQPQICWDMKPVANFDTKLDAYSDMCRSENIEVVGNIFEEQNTEVEDMEEDRQMGITEALELLESHTQYYVPVDDAEAFDMAVDALREKLEQEQTH